MADLIKIRKGNVRLSAGMSMADKRQADTDAAATAEDLIRACWYRVVALPFCP